MARMGHTPEQVIAKLSEVSLSHKSGLALSMGQVYV